MDPNDSQDGADPAEDDGPTSSSRGDGSSSSSGGKSMNKNKERQKETAAADAVTDYVHEAEGDLSAAQKALDSVTSSSSNANGKVLFSGSIAQEDTTQVMDECDLTKEMATQLLMENKGNVALALKTFIKQ